MNDSADKGRGESGTAPGPPAPAEKREPVTHSLKGSMTIDVTKLGNREVEHDG